MNFSLNTVTLVTKMLFKLDDDDDNNNSNNNNNNNNNTHLDCENSFGVFLHTLYFMIFILTFFHLHLHLHNYIFKRDISSYVLRPFLPFPIVGK